MIILLLMFYIFIQILIKKLQKMQKMQKSKQQQRMEMINQAIIKKKKQNPKFQNFQYLREIINFQLGLEVHSLSSKQVIDNAYILVGLTKAGMSTTAHILLNDQLVGRMYNGQLIVQPTTNKYANIKIGNYLGQSQTVFPNIVQLQSNKKQKYHIIDTPGYDHYGGLFYTLCGGYSRYMLFSKVKNIKFILTFDLNSLSNTGHDFIEAIKCFTYNFKNYSSIKQQIWKSCCFLITKTTDGADVQQNIIKKLQLLKVNNMLKQEESQLKQFINFIIREKRIITIKRIQQNAKIQFRGKFNQIDTKITKWWFRKQKNGSVDLEPIQSSLAYDVFQEIRKSRKSLVQFKQLIKYFDITAKQIFQSEYYEQKQATFGQVGQVLKELVKDAMGKPDSHIFLDKMSQYVQNNYTLFDTGYSQARQNYQKQLFGEPENKFNQNSKQTLNQSIKIESKKNYAIKKFKALQNIEQIKNNFYNIQHQNQRSIDYTNKFQIVFVQIIKELCKICYKKNNLTNIIYKYGYVLYRIIEFSKVFILLMDYADNKIKSSLIQQANYRSFNLRYQIRYCFSQSYTYKQQILVSASSQNAAAIYKSGVIHDQISYKQLLQLYVRSFDLSLLNEQMINQQFVILFTSIQINDQQIVKRQVKITLKYAEKIIKDIDNNHDVDLNEKKRLINRLFTSRINCQNIINNCEQDQQQEKKVYIMMLINITRVLGKLLFTLDKFQLARQVYQTIQAVDRIDQIYKKQIHINPHNIVLRIQHANYLLQHFRQEQSIRLLQKACQFALTMDELNDVNQQIISKKIKIDNKLISPQYQEFLFEKKTYYDFEEGLQIKVKNYFEPK